MSADKPIPADIWESARALRGAVNAVAESLLLALFLVIAIIGAAGAAISIAWSAMA